MKKVSISVRDFALPVPRTGSIESNSGYGLDGSLGQSIHTQIQLERSETFSNYQSEVLISHEVEREKYLLKISGRMDGFYSNEKPKIEEIKSGFHFYELAKKLSNDSHHPYCLQLKTYGYFYWLQYQVIPELSFHLVSTRNFESTDLKVYFDIEEYEAWFFSRLKEVEREVEEAEKRTLRRKKLSSELVFPFDHPRTGQMELMQTLEKSINIKEKILIQAPTGLGKTAGILYPSLRDALGRGQRVVYITPKNSQHQVVEDTFKIYQDKKIPLKSLTITAKSKICLKEEQLCNPQYCEYAKNYYAKVYDNKILDSLSKKKKLTKTLFKTLGEKFEVCPFELQVDSLKFADGIICDYNYVFSPRSVLGRNFIEVDQEGNPNLIMDEAHNLAFRAMDYFSPSLSTIHLNSFKSNLNLLPKSFEKKCAKKIEKCIKLISSLGLKYDKPSKIKPPTGSIREMDQNLRQFLTKYLESDGEIKARDPILRLSFYWSEFTEALQFIENEKRDEFFTTFHPLDGGGIINIVCCDASQLIKKKYDAFENVVGFSATLKPFDYYSKLSGLDPLIKTAEFQSPFPPENRKILIIPQISTKYIFREQSYPKIAEAMRRIVEKKNGNYFAFFPSFEFLERVFQLFQPPEGFRAIKQTRNMNLNQVKEYIENLKFSSSTLIFAVQGGVFSEGVDYPCEMIIGAFIVGPPLPHVNLEHEGMKEYFQNKYQMGFDYAYTFPAMAKAIQAAGRVIRSETDRGIIILMDQRFISPQYYQTMPKGWFESDPRELISTSILNDIEKFWQKGF